MFLPTYIILLFVFQNISGRPPLAVITHADVAKEQQLRNTTTHLHSIGVGEHSVFQVGKISSTGKIKSSYKLELLRLLMTCAMEASPIAKHRSRRSFELSQIQKIPHLKQVEKVCGKAEEERPERVLN